MNVQPLENALPSPFPLPEPPGEGFPSPFDAQPLGSDGISRLVPPWLGGSMPGSPLQSLMFGPLSGLIQELMQMLQRLTGQSNGMPGNGEHYFQNANGASVGDPHLSFNGAHWNSMTSHPDLLHSDSIPGGFHISTQVTPPNQNGVAWNQSATVALDNGATRVTMNDNGVPSITNYGQPVPIAAGQTLQLGNGASVTCNQNGSLTVLAQNGTGGEITTTLTAQGKGVNVEVGAQNVDLGGALVRGAQSREQRIPVDNGPIPPLPPLPLPQFPPFPLPFQIPIGERSPMQPLE